MTLSDELIQGVCRLHLIEYFKPTSTIQKIKKQIDEMEEFWNEFKKIFPIDEWNNIHNCVKCIDGILRNQRTQTDKDNEEIVKRLRESNPNMFITLDYNYKEIYHLEFILKNKEQQEELLESIKGEQK